MTRVRAALLLGAMFIAGVVCGGFGVGAFFLYRMHHGGAHPERTDRFVTNRLARRLKLDPAQTEVLRAVVTRTRERMAEARASIHPRILEILDQADAELTPVLRPDQVEELKKIRAEMEQRMESRRAPPERP